MIRFPFFSRRKPAEAQEKPAGTAQQPAPAKRPERPRFRGGVPERAQDLLPLRDGERIGFRKAFDG
jgi:hypothetical protein